MTTSSQPLSNPASFHAEARYQRVCAVCGSAGPFHAHHVVARPLLRRLRLPQYDPRNALRLCHPGCHFAFEWAGPGKIAVPVTCWTDQNVCYVFEALGVTAVQLEKKYGPLDVDERWVKHLNGECELCRSP